MSGYQYIAAPYTDPSTTVRVQRVHASARACHRILRMGGFPYSPLVHGHYIELFGGGQIHYDAWLEHGLRMLKKADAFYILTLDGWQDSNGVRLEKEFARKYGIPIGYLNASVWCNEEPDITRLELPTTERIEQPL